MDSTTAPSVPLDRPLWLYDGDCGPCQQGSERIAATVRPPVDMAAYQSVDLGRLGVSDEDVLRGPVLVLPDGTHRIGPAGMGEMLRRSAQPYRSLGAAMLAPGVRQVLAALGPRMYAQRGRLPGAGASCATTAAG
jgi:hypothetical protein